MADSVYTLDFSTAITGASGYISVEPKDINTNSGYGAPVATVLVSGQSSSYALSFAGTGDTVALKFVLPSISASVGSAGIISGVVVRRINWVEQEVLVTVCEDKDDYRFGMNTQEKTNEIAGTGNHTTALFWEYDIRLGRRWNLDPVDQIKISNYAAFENDPINGKDVLGDQTSFDIRSRQNDQRFLRGKITTKQWEQFYRDNGVAGAIGGLFC